MNLPNKLTLFRVILIPFFVFFLLAPYFEGYGNYIAVAIFIVASITDFLDGKIARKYHLVTNFGKFMDPLADKLLVSSALICLVDLNKIPAWIVIVIIAREFIISGFRLVAADNGVVIAASYWGKFKTAFQMVTVIVLILNIPGEVFAVIGTVLIYISLVLTVISLIDYIAKNKDVLKDQK
ncbi:MAG: CDP-diacylglycerol--glycerol-3-phosphate 3-phosphatidyltransferase [Agathobacter sp.]|jgi:CDP-diacylglycerol---glycerol-3-phosphate 3-phosphatidyltransferase|nr:CDP-diacylglycerol--glycerol-3-phosphate 3-phosphatidyltransferase [Agathobacter sp.]